MALARTPGQSPMFPGSVTSNGLVFTSGLVAGSVPAAMAGGEAVDSLTQIRGALRALLDEVEAAGSSADQVVTVEAFLTSVDQVPDWNAEFLKVWPTPGPARTTTIVGMVHPAILFEVRAVAAL